MSSNSIKIYVWNTRPRHLIRHYHCLHRLKKCYKVYSCTIWVKHRRQCLLIALSRRHSLSPHPMSSKRWLTIPKMTLLLFSHSAWTETNTLENSWLTQRQSCIHSLKLAAGSSARSSSLKSSRARARRDSIHANCLLPARVKNSRLSSSEIVHARSLLTQS